MLIETEIASAGGHELGDVAIQVQTPRNDVELDRSYWLVEVPVNVYGEMTCDRNAGKTFYPFPWEKPDGSSQSVPDIDCVGEDVAECCAKIREFGKTTLGKDKNGKCFACFAHREQLIPKSSTESFEYSYDPAAAAGEQCEKVTLNRDDVAAADDALREMFSQSKSSLRKLRADDVSCDDVESALMDLYVVAPVVPPLSLLLSELSCRYCYDSSTLERDGGFIKVVNRIGALLDPVPRFDASQKTIVIYSDAAGKIVGHPQIGGKRANGLAPMTDGDVDLEGPGESGIFQPDPCSTSDDCSADGFCNMAGLCQQYQELGGVCYGKNGQIEDLEYYADMSLCDPAEAYCFDEAFCSAPDVTVGGICVPWGSSCAEDADCADTEFCFSPGDRCVAKRDTLACCGDKSECISNFCETDPSGLSFTGRICGNF